MTIYIFSLMVSRLLRDIADADGVLINVHAHYSKHRGANTISRRTFIDMKMTRSMYVSEFACGSGKMSYTLLLISKK